MDSITRVRLDADLTGDPRSQKNNRNVESMFVKIHFLNTDPLKNADRTQLSQ